jgi:hypothetical protein
MATYVEPIERIVGAFSDNPVYDALGHRLAEIAATWHTTQAPDLIPRYNAVLQCLVEMGYSDVIAADLHLPDQFMSLEYSQQQWQERPAEAQPVQEEPGGP